MKIFRLLLSASLAATFFVACSPKKAKEAETTNEQPAAAPACTYAYQHDSTSLKWTAYKFTERTGVSGTFDDITVAGTTDADSPEGVLTGATFVINSGSVNSGNAERDPKLVGFFFGKLASPDSISGKIVSISNGEAVVAINMNGKTVETKGQFVADDTHVSLTATIDMADFDGLDAVSSLNEACKKLHTGKDGSSKLWPDVKIEVTSELSKTCN